MSTFVHCWTVEFCSNWGEQLIKVEGKIFLRNISIAIIEMCLPLFAGVTHILHTQPVMARVGRGIQPQM